MVWADKEGNIGWQSVGIAPIRTNFSGLVPVPGDGRFEWGGYLPIVEKPNTFNPSENFFSTANQNVTPEDYELWDAIGFKWSDPFRGQRVKEILGSGKKLALKDMKALQTDYLSIPAKTLVPLILNLNFEDEYQKEAIELLNDWDFRLAIASTAAAVYVAFENELREQVQDRFVPEEVKGIISKLQLKRVIDWMISPDQRFGKDPIAGRDELLKLSFARSISFLKDKLGLEMSEWQYGQKNLKHALITHALSPAVSETLKFQMDVGPLPRGGNGYTPGATSNNYNQSSGATFRIIATTADWDKAVFTNPPGQSGNPDSPFYKNLFNSWANDQYTPLYYSRSKIDSVAAEKTLLMPMND